MFSGKYPYFKPKQTQIMEKELTQAYEAVVESSSKLIELQKERILELEKENASNREVIEKLFLAIDEALDLLKKHNVPTLSLN
jgi:soluble cytochrome b562